MQMNRYTGLLDGNHFTGYAKSTCLFFISIAVWINGREGPLDHSHSSRFNFNPGGE